MSQQRLLVLFGGITVEHEVSVITAVQLMKQVDVTTYQITPVYIDKKGQWWTGEQLLTIEFYKNANLSQPQGLTPFSLSLNFGQNPYDVAILCFHGSYGEAGNIQGALELAGIPYQGPGVISSAICFDKIVLRQILAAENIPQTPFVWFTKSEWSSNALEIQQKIDTLHWPVYVKPANGGSTIGIQRVESAAELSEAITSVFDYDQRVIVEAEVQDCIEVNVSVLGIQGQAQASVPEQPIKTDALLSFADKYERGGGKKSGMASATRRIPAPISSDLTKKVQAMALEVFRILDCTGVIRIDLFVNPSTEEIYVIEPNTIPGSMSYYLWEATGLPYKELIDTLVTIALERKTRQQSLTTTFDSNILKQAKS